MNLLKPNWNDQVSWQGVGGSLSPDSDGVVTIPSGNPSAEARITRLNRARGHTVEFSANVRSSGSAIPAIIIRGFNTNGNQVSLGNSNQVRYPSDADGQWRRISCRISFDHPMASYLQFAIDNRGGDSEWQIKDLAISAVPNPGQYGTGLSGWFAGNPSEGAFMYPDGRLEAWISANLDLTLFNSDITLPTSVARIAGDTPLHATISSRDQAGFASNAQYMGQVVVRARRGPNNSLQATIFNPNPSPSALTVPVMVRFFTPEAERCGY